MCKTNSKQVFRNRMKWIRRLKQNNPKTTAALKDWKGTCCLGEWCIVDKVQNIKGAYLPQLQANHLDIPRNGGMTKEGKKFMFAWFNKTEGTWGNLTIVNDVFSNSHKQTAEFLEAIFAEEYLFGKDMFNPPQMRC